MEKNQSLSYLETVSNIIICATLFLLPIFFLTNTTDFFTIPKQLLIIFSTIILLVLWGVKILIERKITVNINPFNLPIIIFGVICLVSALLSRNRFDSLTQTIPLIFLILFFFMIVNNLSDRKTFSFVLSSFVMGAAVSALITLAYYFKFYFLPIPAIQNQFFNTTGSVIQQLLYLVPVLVLSLLYIGRQVGFPKIKLADSVKSDFGFFVQVITAIFVLAGLALLIYQIVFLPNKPIILPYIYGFQTAFAAVSQDTQRFLLSLLFGSGYGTFLVDFTRFKLPAFNLEQDIWNLTFSYSSSWFLELIATTGILGAISYLLIIFAMFRARVTRNPLFIALFITFVLSLILPFSFVSIALLFVLLGIYVSYLNISQDKRSYDVGLSLVASKNGMLSLETNPEGSSKSESPILVAIVFVLIILLVGFAGLFAYKFAVSDVAFAKSLIAANQNNGQATYELQTQAINDFPYRSDYHRIFSQVNLALANSISSGIQAGSSPSAQIQQNIVTLLQQSINSGRNAVIIAPLTSSNWQNLGQIYRSLIGVGQNAEQFAVSSVSQAIALDPYNPQLYIQLGGIYYQLEQWDTAQSQFEVAIRLKRDFANAYYNLGHTFEQKNDLKSALSAYQIVKQLSAGNQENLSKIDEEIKAVEAKIGETAQKTEEIQPETEQTPLGISGPSSNIPPQKPPIKISPPPDGDEEATQSGNSN